MDVTVKCPLFRLPTHGKDLDAPAEWVWTVDLDELESNLQERLERVELDVLVEDVGIGPYEYWGSKEVDSRIEITEVTAETVQVTLEPVFEDESFETDEEREETACAALARVALPTIHGSGTTVIVVKRHEVDRHYDYVWAPGKREGLKVPYGVSLD